MGTCTNNNLPKVLTRRNGEIQAQSHIYLSPKSIFSPTLQSETKDILFKINILFSPSISDFRSRINQVYIKFHNLVPSIIIHFKN